MYSPRLRLKGARPGSPPLGSCRMAADVAGLLGLWDAPRGAASPDVLPRLDAGAIPTLRCGVFVIFFRNDMALPEEEEGGGGCAESEIA